MIDSSTSWSLSHIAFTSSFVNCRTPVETRNILEATFLGDDDDDVDDDDDFGVDGAAGDVVPDRANDGDAGDGDDDDDDDDDFNALCDAILTIELMSKLSGFSVLIRNDDFKLMYMI